MKSVTLAFIDTEPKYSSSCNITRLGETLCLGIPSKDM